MASARHATSLRVAVVRRFRFSVETSRARACGSPFDERSM